MTDDTRLDDGRSDLETGDSRSQDSAPDDSGSDLETGDSRSDDSRSDDTNPDLESGDRDVGDATRDIDDASGDASDDPPGAPTDEGATGAAPAVPTPETRIPDEETPAALCPYCERPFRSRRQRDLHLGHAHGDDLTDEDRAAYEDAVDEESEELWVYHMKVVVALGVIYAAFVLSYTVLVSM